MVLQCFYVYIIRLCRQDLARKISGREKKYLLTYGQGRFCMKNKTPCCVQNMIILPLNSLRMVLSTACHPIHNILFDHGSWTCSTRAKCHFQGEQVNIFDWFCSDGFLWFLLPDLVNQMCLLISFQGSLSELVRLLCSLKQKNGKSNEWARRCFSRRIFEVPMESSIYQWLRLHLPLSPSVFLSPPFNCWYISCAIYSSVLFTAHCYLQLSVRGNTFITYHIALAVQDYPNPLTHFPQTTMKVEATHSQHFFASIHSVSSSHKTSDKWFSFPFVITL